MFHHHAHHESESVAERIDHLMAGVFVVDDRDRLARLAVHVAPEFVYIGPGGVFDGAQGLSDAFVHYRHEAGRHTALRRTSAVDLHHGQFRYSWARTDDGGPTVEGSSFGVIDAGGRIARIVSFDGPGRERT